MLYQKSKSAAFSCVLQKRKVNTPFRKKRQPNGPVTHCFCLTAATLFSNSILTFFFSFTASCRISLIFNSLLYLISLMSISYVTLISSSPFLPCSSFISWYLLGDIFIDKLLFDHNFFILFILFAFAFLFFYLSFFISPFLKILINFN